MSTTPTGAAPWSRTADHTIYGGNVSKVNLHSQGVTNPLTDVGAEAFCRMTADEAAVVRTAPWCTITVTCRDTIPGAPLIEAVHQMTGIRLAQYAGDSAPSGFPSAARNGNGDVTITWAASYVDPYGVSEPLVIKHAHVSALSDSSAIAANPNILSAVAVRVRCRFYPGGTDASDAKFTLEVA